MIILFVISILAACSLLYLSHRHQGWLAQPLAVKPWRLIGFLLLLLALVCGLRCFSTIAAVFAWLAIAMLVFSLLPFFSLLIKRSGRERS